MSIQLPAPRVTRSHLETDQDGWDGGGGESAAPPESVPKRYTHGMGLRFVKAPSSSLAIYKLPVRDFDGLDLFKSRRREDDNNNKSRRRRNTDPLNRRLVWKSSGTTTTLYPRSRMIYWLILRPIKLNSWSKNRPTSHIPPTCYYPILFSDTYNNINM